MKYLMLSAALIAAPAMAAQPELTVYAPEYFASEWGPGPKIEAGFEAICGCDLVFVTGDVLPRLLLEGKANRADIAIGLNTDQTARARETGLFAPHGQDTGGLTIPVQWDDDTFLPFNWSQLAFIYDATRLPNPPASFADFQTADIKVAIQDPRSSSLGLSMLMWVKAVYGDDAPAVWANIAPRVLTVTKGWSEAYGMFTDGEVDMVLSFTTSPAYHIMAEDDTTKHAAIWPEGHYLYTELAGRLATSDQPELAQTFMDYILSPDFQGMIAEANWSFPAQLPREDWPQTFRELPQPETTLFMSETEAEALRKPALDEWLAAFAR